MDLNKPVVLGSLGLVMPSSTWIYHLKGQYLSIYISAMQLYYLFSNLCGRHNSNRIQHICCKFDNHQAQS